MVTLNPDDLLFTARVGEAPNLREEVPVVAGEAGKVEVGEDVAQKNQPVELHCS